jgi:lysyl-tRNA synthetase class 2
MSKKNRIQTVIAADLMLVTGVAALGLATMSVQAQTNAPTIPSFFTTAEQWISSVNTNYSFAGVSLEASTGYKQQVGVNSSNLRAVGHDGRTLTIEFHGGRIYEYDGVPREEFLGLLQAGSPGGYFHAHIKDRYHSNRIQ